METLDEWIGRQYTLSTAGMLLSISTSVIKNRPGFGQVIRPRKGSVVASPVPASYDPDPDYFFHWFRDSALVLDAVRVLSEDADAAVYARRHFSDFVHFSASLRALDGRNLAESTPWRASVSEEFKQYLRGEADLAQVRRDEVGAETRVNPDGTLDISRWARPQYDGPALRALVLLRWMNAHSFDPRLTSDVERLLLSDLEMILQHADDSSFDIWEEEFGRHYYTLRVSAAALRVGARWLDERSARTRDRLQSQSLKDTADRLLRELDGFWSETQQHFFSRVLDAGAPSAKQLDMSVILAAIHAGAGEDLHAAHDPRMHSTLARLEALFDTAYDINRSRAPERGPAMGRYAGDTYVAGGAYYFSTLGAAEFCFQAALRAAEPAMLMQRGDAYLETVRAFTPPNGDLSEQFDQNDGSQRSAKHLAWSYAAFISCIAARRRASREVKRAPTRSTARARRRVQRDG